MKFSMSRCIFSGLVTVSLLTVYASPALAIKDESPLQISSVYMSAADKHAFAAEKEREYAQNTNAQVNSAIDQQDKIDQLILRAASSSNPSEVTAIQKELEMFGVYLYKSGTDAPSTRSSNSDVNISAPDIYYNTGENTWTVATGGYWRNDEWKRDHGVAGTVGDPDAFGVGYSNVSGTYSAHIVRQTASINNGKTGSDYEGILTSNRSDGDGQNGFGFRLQDEVILSNVFGSLEYIGAKWAGACTYDYDFAEYNGNAYSYYVHTYRSCTISELEFNITNPPAVTFSISSTEDGFGVLSVDTSF